MRFQLKLFRDEDGLRALECDAAGVEEARAVYAAQGWEIPLGHATDWLEEESAGRNRDLFPGISYTHSVGGL